MLLGVPVFAVIYYIAGEIIEHLLLKKNLPVSEESYTSLHHVEPDLTFSAIDENLEAMESAKSTTSTREEE